MKVVVACGGTGGHAYPGLAVAEELRQRGNEVVVWDSGRDIESNVMKRWEGTVFSTGAKQIALKNVFLIWRSLVRCRKELKRNRCDVMLAMGSYSSLPPVIAARSLGIKVVLHEANAVPGKAVEFLSRFADCVALSFSMAAEYFTRVKSVLTGLPVRSEIAKGTRFPFIPKDAFVIFVTGGSQGAHAVNMLVKDALKLLKQELDSRGNARKLYVIHQTGARDEGPVKSGYAHIQLPSRVHAFEREMDNAFASADIVIARAGASTCFELAICGKPSILIPLPSAMRNHQHFNAEAFVASGAAIECVQARLTPRSLCRQLLYLYDHPERCAAMAEKIRTLASDDAAKRVADLVCSFKQ